MQRTTTQGSAAGLETAMETLNISPDQVQESSRGSDQHRGRQAGSQQSAQIDGAPTGKASDEEVWYLQVDRIHITVWRNAYIQCHHPELQRVRCLPHYYSTFLARSMP